jgi:hypothetical protein
MSTKQIAGYNLQGLQEKHREILRRKVEGASDTDIAKELGVSTALVQYTRRSEVGQEFIGALELAEDEQALNIKRQIEEAAASCLQLELDVALGRLPEANVTHRLKAAQDILDRGNFPRRTNVDATVGGALTTETALEALKRQAKKLGLIREVTEVAAEVLQ